MLRLRIIFCLCALTITIYLYDGDPHTSRALHIAKGLLLLVGTLFLLTYTASKEEEELQ